MVNEPRLTHQSLRALKLFAEDPSTRLAGSDIMKATGLSSGTLYPILLRFEHHGLLESVWEREKPEVLGRPRRRLYSITTRGREVAYRALTELGVESPFLRPDLSRA